MKNKMLSDREIIKRASKYVLPYWKTFLFALILLFINVAISIVLPIIISSSTKELNNLVEATLHSPSYYFTSCLILAASYLVLSICNVVLSYFMSLILQKVGQQIVINLRNDVFDHIESLSLAQFNDIPVGKLVSRVSNDTISLSDMFSTLIVNLIKNTLLIVLTFGVMFFVDYKLALYMLIFVALVTIVSLIFKVTSKKAFRKERGLISDMNGFLSENLNGMKITQVFNQEDKVKKEYDEKNKKLRRASYEVMLTFSFYRPVVSLIYVLAIATCFYIGVPSIESSTFFLFYLYLGHFFEPIQQLADLLNGFQRGMAASERIFMLLDQKPLIKDEGEIELDHFDGNIKFDHVYFAYTNEDWVLKDISFEVHKGEQVAFVGQTGAGKTTILSLIVRNYDIQRGHIYIDNIDIKKIKLSSLRKHIGQMLQDVFLFSGTIKSNIRLRDEDITDEEIIKSCEYVSADRFINKLEKKYDQEVKENGHNFSIGQRQLLSFARTIVRKPSILILDEATANIDTETEILIQDSLNKMKQIGTMLIVAHRLSTIKNADKIIVIEHGEITESGTHEELLKNKKYYYKLCSLTME